MGLNYLMDSNVIIDYTGENFTGSAELKLDTAFNGVFYYSIISRIEVIGFNTDAAILQDLHDFLALGQQYYVTDEIAIQTIFIRRALTRIKMSDAIIAATALVHHHTLVSRNLHDFKNIPGLKVIDPYTL